MSLKIGTSALTGTIFIGSVGKTGLWGKNRTDVTDEAVFAVVEHLNKKGKYLF